MIKVFNSDDKTYETNGNVVLNPTYANIHKEDNGDYYLDLETSIEEDKIKHIEHEEGTTIETTGTTLTDVDTTKEHKFISLYGETQQDSTTGKNLLRNDLTSQTINGLTITINDDKTIKINGTASANTWLNINSSFNFESGKTYILSGCPQNGSLATYYMYVNGQSMQDVGSGVSKTFSENITTDILIKISKNAVLSNLIFKPMLRLSNTTSDYEPYTNGASPNPDYPQPIHNVSGDNTIEICGKNFFDKDNLNWFYGWVSSANSKIVHSGSNDKTLYIRCQPNTKYTISKVSSSRFYVCTATSYENNTPVSNAQNRGSATKYTITSGANDIYICLTYYYSSDTLTEQQILDSIMIEKGEVETPIYEAYQGNSQLISLGDIELCKISTYQDYIYKDNDRWFLHKEIGKVVLNGSENNWNTRSNTSTSCVKFYNTTALPSNIISNLALMSNYFVANTGANNASYSGNAICGNSNQYAKWIHISIDNTIVSDLAGFKTWLGTHNLVIYYALQTSTDTEITDTTLLEQLNNFEKMRLYQGITNISITPNDLTPTLKLHYNYMTGGDVVINNNDYIKSNNIIVANTPTGEQAFRITDIEKRKHKIVLKAWHISYDTKNYVIQDSYVVDKTCNQAMDHLNNATDNTSPFTTTSDIATINSYRCVRRSLFEAFNVVLERWGGHFVRDNWNFKIMNSIGQDNGVVVRYAKNLKDIQVTYDWTNVVTKILPVGNDGLLLDEVFLYADIQYDIPYTKIVHFDQNINENDYRDEQGILDEDAYLEALKNDLRSQATLYLQENYLPQVNYSLNANLEKITDIGDTIQVKDERLGVDITTNLISYDYDCILEKYTNLEFGNFTKTISDLTSYINSQTSQIVDESVSTTRITLENELETATSQIWGVLGSSYVLNEGDKILIVDSLPKETATNVIMINSAGIGFSQTGINGTFSTALTIDGTFNTSNVNVINFTADLIKGGVLKLGSNLNQNGILEVYDEANNLIAVLNKDGLRMNAVNGAYVLINQQVGFAGYDKNDNPIYWVSEDEFHMKKSVVEEEITLVDKMRIIPITITDNGTITNDGIGFVSTL